ncbi:MAG: DUF2272 domain-containing protein [Pseudoxanthomonas sp.]|nr:DUF2272 domain-containing protein [Pseudoxanthomonas sp.]
MRRLHALALLALAASAAGTAHAAQGGVEVCDLPPRFGIEATAAAIIRIACDEHRLWTRPFIEADGRVAWLGVTEGERIALADDYTPAWQRVAKYWRESGTLSAMGSTAGAASCLYPGTTREAVSDCRAFIIDNPWSAAFVSWVMMRAPLPEFFRSPRHMDYIARAWRNPELSPYLYMDPFTGRPVPGDLLCFLRADDQGRGTAGLRAGLSGNGPLPAYSHCDIVVAANVGGDRTLYLVGGNVLNTVMMRKLPLDASGRLLPGPLQAAAEDALRGESRVAGRPVTGTAAAPPAAGAVTMGGTSTTSAPVSDEVVPPACRPGNPSACSFNRRDWVALLKLKPQAQLRGGYPPPAPFRPIPAGTGTRPAPAPAQGVAIPPAGAPAAAPAVRPPATPASSPPRQAMPSPAAAPAAQEPPPPPAGG